MLQEEIARESRELWAHTYAAVNWPDQYVREFPQFLASKEREARREARQNLQPWLQILDDSIQWLMVVVCIFEELKEREKLDRPELSIFVLIGASCAHAVAVRKLVLSGLDGSARLAVRSLDEHLCAALTFLHDRELGKAFQECKTEDEADNFWFKNLNSRAMRKKAERDRTQSRDNTSD